ncbi:MAG: hypothetical protein ABIC04_07220 [Nanoarchaeota archaeon]
MNERKERLEKELRFLKESLDSEIITPEEHDQNKQIIEEKLKDIGNFEESNHDENKSDDVVSEPQEEQSESNDNGTYKTGDESIEETDEEQPSTTKIEDNESTDDEEIYEEQQETSKLAGRDSTDEVESFAKSSDDAGTESAEDGSETNAIGSDGESEADEDSEMDDEEKTPKDEYVFINKKIIFAIVAIILVLVVFFIIKLPKNSEEPIEIEAPKEVELAEAKIEPLCISDNDCEIENKIGICLEAGTQGANCLFKDPIRIDMTVLNDKNCKSCDSSRIELLVKKLFPGIVIEEVDYNTREGKKLIQELDLNVLPSYIFSEELDKAYNYANKTERIFDKIGDKYVMLPTATDANYYFVRADIPNKLDLFILSDELDRNENNVEELLDTFGGNINFEKHIVTDSEKIEAELGVTTFPVFLVNNRLKFGGVQPADFIKTKFCELNNLEGCSVTLSENIK